MRVERITREEHTRFINQQSSASFLQLPEWGDVKKECDVCHLKYEREPGFYYGAMYVSYALGVALFVTVWTSCNIWFPWLSEWSQIGLVVFFTIVLK